MSDLERLNEVLDAYGASADRWPTDERASLERLIETSAQARALHEDVARFDRLLDAAGPIDTPSPALFDRIVDKAPRSTEPSAIRRWAPLVPIAAAAMLALWIARDPASRTDSPIAPPPDPSIEIAMVDLGVYTTPTDVLLSVDGFDPLANVPTWGCEDTEFGCIDLDFDGAETHSLQGGSRRMRT